MTAARTKWRPGIAAKSWFVATLTLAALAALALPALRLSDISSGASSYVGEVVLGGLTTAAELQIKLEKHRRLVESAPAEVDRSELERGQQTAAHLEAEILELVRAGDAKLADAVGARLPELSQYRAQVFLFALNFAQEKATAATNQYAKAASILSDRIGNYRREQGHAIEAWSIALQDDAKVSSVSPSRSSMPRPR